MDFNLGDWVTTADSQSGKVIDTCRSTVFVAFRREGQFDLIVAFLQSQLTKTDPPCEREKAA